MLCIEEIDELLDEIRIRVLQANRTGTLDQMLASMGMHDLIETQPQLGSRNGKIVVNLCGRLNKCGVISPRFDVALRDMEKWTTNLLPSRQFGFIVLTTSGALAFTVYCDFAPPYNVDGFFRG